MPRSSKGPWFRKGRGWYVEHRNKQLFLSADEEEAQQKWHLLQGGVPINIAVDGSATFAELMEAYLTEIKRTRTERHYRGTRWRLDQLSERWAKRSVSSLKLADVEKAMKAHAWGPTTQANVIAALRSLLRWASRPGGLIPENPLPVLTLPRAETRVNTLTKAQVKSLLKAAGEPLRTILKALAETGARPSELIRATAADCDPDGTAIRLARGKQGRRIIFFPKASRAAIAKLRKRSTGPLFTQPNGEAWSEYWLYALARKARKKAKLPEWATCYALRHTWITERLRQRKPVIPIATVARMAGTSVTLIDKVYGHLSDQDLKAVADEMG